MIRGKICKLLIVFLYFLFKIELLLLRKGFFLEKFVFFFKFIFDLVFDNDSFFFSKVEYLLKLF